MSFFGCRPRLLGIREEPGLAQLRLELLDMIRRDLREILDPKGLKESFDFVDSLLLAVRAGRLRTPGRVEMPQFLGTSAAAE
jgi:hypothetical protein